MCEVVVVFGIVVVVFARLWWGLEGCGGVCKVVVVFARLWWCLEGCGGVWKVVVVFGRVVGVVI